MLKKFLNVLVAAMLVTTILLSIIPTAAAQSAQLVVELQPSPDKLRPLQGQITIPGKVTYTADQTAQTGIIGVPVTLTVRNAPSWAAVTISPQTVIMNFANAQPGASVTATANFNVFVSASEQAPAYQAAPIEIAASAAQPSAAGASATGQGSIPIQAEFFSIIDVQLAEAIKVDRPQQPVVFPLTITNFGNANTKVSFQVVSQAENLEVPVPGDVTLQSKQAGGNQITATVPLTVQTPYKNGYMNEVGSVTYKVTSAYALNPQLKGDESTVSVLVTTKGFYVPGFEPLLLIGLLGLSAVAMRRFRSS